MRSGKNIILTTHGPQNLSKFTIDELREILGYLDLISSGEHKFDQLRATIADEIANSYN